MLANEHSFVCWLRIEGLSTAELLVAIHDDFISHLIHTWMYDQNAKWRARVQADTY